MNTPIRSICSALLLSGSLLTLSSPAWAVQKFGYINPERVYTETHAAQRIEATWQREFGGQQQKLLAIQQEGIRLQQQLKTGKLSTSARKQTEKRLQETGKQYRITSAQLTEEYNLRRNEEFASLQNQANIIIKRIAEQERYDLIVQEAVYVTHEYDITDRVIKLLDEQMP